MMQFKPTTGWVRSRRPTGERPQPSRPWGHSWEREREADGALRSCLTLFLTGAECPFACTFCDLWRYTHKAPTEVGSIPHQIAELLRDAGAIAPRSTIKLYNASNYFDRRAVPEADDEAVASLVSPFDRVTVESHPRFVGNRTLRFADKLSGRLEVALGLETVHPEAFPRLNKATTLPDLNRSVRWLREREIEVRLFVQISPPFVRPEVAVDWAVRSVRHALSLGARHVSLIPTRGGNGALDDLQEQGEFTPTRLDQLEEALERALLIAGQGIVTADLWDLTTTHAKEEGVKERIARLTRTNEIGRSRPDLGVEDGPETLILGALSG